MERRGADDLFAAVDTLPPAPYIGYELPYTHLAQIWVYSSGFPEKSKNEFCGSD
jgi:hypothetical protein